MRPTDPITPCRGTLTDGVSGQAVQPLSRPPSPVAANFECFSREHREEARLVWPVQQLSGKPVSGGEWAISFIFLVCLKGTGRVDEAAKSIVPVFQCQS